MLYNWPGDPVFRCPPVHLPYLCFEIYDAVLVDEIFCKLNEALWVGKAKLLKICGSWGKSLPLVGLKGWNVVDLPPLSS